MRHQYNSMIYCRDKVAKSPEKEPKCWYSTKCRSMETELKIWHKCKHNLSCFAHDESPNRYPHLEALASARSLIVNSSTSNEILSQIFEFLAQCLQQGQEPLVHHVLKLLSDLALCHPDSSRHICDTVYAYISHHRDASHLTVEAFKVLLMIADHNQTTISSTISIFNEEFFLLLCFSPSASVRSWVLCNANRFHVPQHLLVTVLLRFTKDPYPCVRKDALGSLVNLCKVVDVNDFPVIQECYGQAIELLFDVNEFVRSTAVRVVSALGPMLAVVVDEVDNQDWSDTVFAQLCSVARDMCLEVRNETFLALGRIRVVSEDILLQTLSKKMMESMKDRKISGRLATKEFNLAPSSVAGVFLHGLEDEFSEVRDSACRSLGMLTSTSLQFANKALDFLMDLLNDNSMAVRLQSLEAMYHMAKCHCLDVQEMHMHMFLGTLVDGSTIIRHAARNVLHVLKLPSTKIFKSAICGLLSNLERYFQDEDDIISVIFHIGRSHAELAISFAKDVSAEIEPSCEGELCLDQARVAALLVLAISSSISCEDHSYRIPTRFFSYAIPFLGKIANALRDVTDQDHLLACICHCSKFMHFSAPFGEGELFSTVIEEDIVNHKYEERIDQTGNHMLVGYGASESQFQKMNTMPKEAISSVQLILGVVTEAWPLINSGFTAEAQRLLRICKEKLARISASSHENVGLVAFTYQYISVVQLLAKVWECMFPQRKFHDSKTSMLNYFLDKLDKKLRGLRYRFSGFSKEEELHVLELVILSFVLRFSNAEICCHLSMLKILHSTFSHMELLGGALELSKFVKELKSFFQERSLDDERAYHPYPFRRLLELFTLKKLSLSGRFKHIKAELDFPGDISDNAVPFIPGLPVGITFQITLYNISKEDKLWLKMSLEDQTQFVFLDTSQIGTSEMIEKVCLTVPLYKTPKAISFTIRTSIGKECPLVGAAHLSQGTGGPKHELVCLCKEKEVHLVLKS